MLKWVTPQKIDLTPDSGCAPFSSLISDGTFLYGMTVYCGADNIGTIFKILPDGSEFEVLLDFDDDPHGAWGYGHLIFDGTYLYGMTNQGGETNQGTIFKIMPDGTGYVKLLDFDSTTGFGPLGSLVSDGTFLYGMTSVVSNNFGTLFKIMPDGSGFMKLMEFDGSANGGFPLGTLIIDGDFLFGMTKEGGVNSFGTIFKHGIDTAVEENQLRTNFSVYPNPTDENINLKWMNNSTHEQVNISISDINGKIVWQSAQVMQNVSVDVSHLSEGVYTVVVQKDGSSAHQTFIKIR